MADYYLGKTAAHIDELLEKVEGLENYDDTEVRGLINNKVDKETGKGLSTNDFTNDYKASLDNLSTALSNKVDKVSGKGLSENDYTTAEKTKLEGIESGAEVNVQVDWNQTTTTADDYIKNKPTIPAAQVPSDWTATQGVSRIINKPTLGSAASKNYTTSVTSGSNDLVTSDAVYGAVSTKADLIDGKVPMSQMPPAVIERMIPVEDDNVRFHLTKSQVQNGDTVKVLTTNKMYLVVDDDHLDTEAGYSVYVAGRAAEAVADEDGNNIKTTYATKAMTKTSWEGTAAGYEALTSDDYDLYFVEEGSV